MAEATGWLSMDMRTGSTQMCVCREKTPSTLLHSLYQVFRGFASLNPSMGVYHWTGLLRKLIRTLITGLDARGLFFFLFTPAEYDFFT